MIAVEVAMGVSEVLYESAPALVMAQSISEGVKKFVDFGVGFGVSADEQKGINNGSGIGSDKGSYGFGGLGDGA